MAKHTLSLMPFKLLSLSLYLSLSLSLSAGLYLSLVWSSHFLQDQVKVRLLRCGFLRATDARRSPTASWTVGCAPEDVRATGSPTVVDWLDSLDHRMHLDSYRACNWQAFGKYCYVMLYYKVQCGQMWPGQIGHCLVAQRLKFRGSMMIGLCPGTLTVTTNHTWGLLSFFPR